MFIFKTGIGLGVGCHPCSFYERSFHMFITISSLGGVFSLVLSLFSGHTSSREARLVCEGKTFISTLISVIISCSTWLRYSKDRL